MALQTHMNISAEKISFLEQYIWKFHMGAQEC